MTPFPTDEPGVFEIAFSDGAAGERATLVAAMDARSVAAAAERVAGRVVGEVAAEVYGNVAFLLPADLEALVRHTVPGGAPTPVFG